MPAVQPPAKVLVSGATGFIAAWVVKNLLERGYVVRGTARSLAKGGFLKTLFASYGDRFELVVVEDVAQVSSSTLVPRRSDTTSLWNAKYQHHESRHLVPGRYYCALRRFYKADHHFMV